MASEFDDQAALADNEDGGEKTQPPVSALRFDTPAELYAGLPRVRGMTQHRPREGERNIDYLQRLRGSTTPEEAVTFTAFALVPKMAIWWGYECLRLSSDDLSAADRELMELVATWMTNPDSENRFRAMRTALYARSRTPQVFLGLAVGWSGGPIAPNDPAQVLLHRAPQAINSAVLSSLARADMSQRPVRLARFIDQAAALFRF
ncbi:DUF6931 family protein [Thetidibacter halocola]|uniref:Uncharacterized protein n=1 Tax=Thetidibacter halocola TaxID=2827239 RepID=A0A8J7WB87_9RHOB|nr:hypothetical protein [Thetidibacter halocola]MBS0123567.1 hypothetical protein [Thetidibacter halocola]